jgi:hypothetical protein
MRVYYYGVISNAPTTLKKRHCNWCVRATQDAAADGIKTMKKSAQIQFSTPASARELLQQHEKSQRDGGVGGGAPRAALSINVCV